MARGKFQINSTLATATDPDDTTLLAAPGAGESIYIIWLDLIVTTSQAATRVEIEDGVGGSVLASGLATALGTVHLINQPGSRGDGLRLTANTLLNATSIGGTTLAGRIVGEVEVR